MYYDNSTIGNASTVGAIKLKFTPGYSGTPSVNTTIFEIKHPSANDNRIIVFHGSTGAIRLTINDDSGTVIHSAYSLPSWSPTSGTTYELELNFNAPTGEIDLFVDF